MYRAASLSAITVALAVAGCAVDPDFHRPAAPTDSGYTPEPLRPQTASARTRSGEAQHFEPRFRAIAGAAVFIPRGNISIVACLCCSIFAPSDHHFRGRAFQARDDFPRSGVVLPYGGDLLAQLPSSSLAKA